jgi:large conductance mechanosensitive channel
MLKEFKEFAMRGNVIDLAVGVIVGGAFGKVVTSLVNDILMPPLGLLIGNVDFKDLALTLKSVGADGKPVLLKVGMFINACLDFVIVSFCIFLVIHGLNKLKREQAVPPPAPSEKVCPQCCMIVPIQARRCGHCTGELSLGV